MSALSWREQRGQHEEAAVLRHQAERVGHVGAEAHLGGDRGDRAALSSRLNTGEAIMSRRSALSASAASKAVDVGLDLVEGLAVLGELEERRRVTTRDARGQGC